MNYKFIKIKPLIYTMAALIVLYFIFHIRQKVAAQNNRTGTSVSNIADSSITQRRQSSASTENTAANQRGRENTPQQRTESRESAGTNQPEQRAQVSQSENQGDSNNQNSFARRFNEAANSGRAQAERKNPSFGFLEIIFVLLILGLAFYLFYRFFSRKKEGSQNTTDYITVLSSTPLAVGKQLQVVQVFNRVYILGVGENSINLITEVTDQNLIAQMRSDASKRLPSLSFKEQILKFIHKMKLGASIKSDPEEEALSFFKNHREKLDSLNGKNKDSDNKL
jgi:flagellar protein FliO/FliZ